MAKNNNNMTSLNEAMRANYVDSEGKIIAEAMDLGQLFLRFSDAMHKAKEIAFRVAPERGAQLDDFFFTLAAECGSEEAYNHYASNIRTGLANIKALNEELGNHVSDAVLNVVVPILQNKMYKHDRAHVILQVMWVECVKRHALAYSFAGKDEVVSKANFQCSLPILDWIAFLCDSKYDRQYKMALTEQNFMRKVLQDI